jgi:hypothetical protein
MNRGPRNASLLQQLSESNPFRKAVAGAFDIAAGFERNIEAVALRRDLSPEGKKAEAQKHMRRALRELLDLRKPIDESRAKTEAMNAAAQKLPAIDKTDDYAAGLRKELRDLSRGMTPGQRAMRMTGSARSTDFIDAILEREPWVSGIDVHTKEGQDAKTYEEAKESRLKDLHAPLLAATAERKRTEDEASVINVAFGDIENDSGMAPKDFEAIAKLVEAKIPFKDD